MSVECQPRVVCSDARERGREKVDIGDLVPFNFATGVDKNKMGPIVLSLIWGGPKSKGVKFDILKIQKLLHKSNTHKITFLGRLDQS